MQDQRRNEGEQGADVRTNQVRQGVTGNNVRYVLMVALGSVVVLFILLGILAKYDVFTPPPG